MNYQALNGNWIDLVILIVIGYFLIQAWGKGVWIILAEFLSFFGSLLLSLRAYTFISDLLQSNFTLPKSVANALGFLVTAVILEMLLGYLLIHAFVRLPKKFWHRKVSQFLGLIPAFGEAVILTSFILVLILGLPIRPEIKTAVANSKIGSVLVEKTSVIENSLSQIFGGVIEDSLTYFTIKPESNESVPLQIEVGNLTIDETSEQEMFAKVNEERKKEGRRELIWDPKLVPVARAHSRDMWERKYFAHVSPEGMDVGDRLNQANINYFVAGENLALAPTVQTAHTGLMNSEGHRRNILEPQFGNVGIGVIDNGYWGKMFVQVFTD